MPTIYLSPSTQEKNLYVNGGTEEYYMNLIADAMIPYLNASGINYVRNTPEMTAASSIRASNAGNYDFHLALHSNAAPENRYGQVRGTDVYYSPNSTSGRRAAEIFAQNLKEIYPIPSLVRAVPTTSLGEVTRTNAPAVLIEFAYHDNIDDANWIKSNIDNIAANVVYSLTEYFGIPFKTPQPVRTGTVVVSSGSVNVRNRPSTDSAVIGGLYNGQTVRVLGTYLDWDIIDFNGQRAYVYSDYIRIQ